MICAVGHAVAEAAQCGSSDLTTTGHASGNPPVPSTLPEAASANRVVNMGLRGAAQRTGAGRARRARSRTLGTRTERRPGSVGPFAPGCRGQARPRTSAGTGAVETVRAHGASRISGLPSCTVDMISNPLQQPNQNPQFTSCQITLRFPNRPLSGPEGPSVAGWASGAPRTRRPGSRGSPGSCRSSAARRTRPKPGPG